MNLNSVDLNKISVFCQVLESGSLRQASELLNVTPSALSQSLSTLEHALGFPLFHRAGRRLVPTEEGKVLHREFRRSHQRFQDALESLSRNRERITGLLRIGAYLEFAKSQLAPVLTDFLRAHPAVQAKLSFETPTRLHRMLETGKIDLCFSIFPAKENARIESRKVYFEELVLISPAHLLSAVPTFDELKAAPFIEYYFNHQPLRRWFRLHFRRCPKEPRIRAYAATAEMVLVLVRQGLGAGVVPRYLLNPAEVGRSYVICRPTEKRFMDHIWMLQAKTGAKSAAHKSFTDFTLRALAGREAPAQVSGIQT